MSFCRATADQLIHCTWSTAELRGTAETSTGLAYFQTLAIQAATLLTVSEAPLRDSQPLQTALNDVLPLAVENIMGYAGPLDLHRLADAQRILSCMSAVCLRLSFFSFFSFGSSEESVLDDTE